MPDQMHLAELNDFVAVQSFGSSPRGVDELITRARNLASQLDSLKAAQKAIAPGELAMLDILAGIAASVARIGENTAHPAPELTPEVIVDKWPLRMYEEHAVPFVKSLGIEVIE